MSKQNQVRIIGGQWRSRKISFPDQIGLRPTPDRVRETLFNWLSPYIQGARCLDLFAGSGALSFEALSRGAQSATLIDQSSEITLALQKQAQLLNATNIQILCGKFPNINHLLKEQLFDIIFLDPPFQQDLVESACKWLVQNHHLAPKAFIYIEAENTLTSLPSPSNWKILKSKITGHIGYHLLQVDE